MTGKLSIEQQGLVVSHLSLAHKLARSAKKKASFLNYDELESAAYLGLTEAALKFDSNLGISFETFASCRVSGAIKDYMRELSWGSRNNPVKTESFESQEEPTYNDKVEEKVDIFEKITDPLPSINKKILRLHYVEEVKIKEIADGMGVHESRVSQILSASRNNLRQYWEGTKSELWAEVA
jgi:RNA polymerase sigma factor (sigma-70 family)